MSYSTQREFFNVSFPNEDPKAPVRKRSDGAIMTYDFCTDGRAWALDSKKRSNYIQDIVIKALFQKAIMHPEGEFELTKDHLLRLDVDDLAEYVLRLQSEVKRKNESVKRIEEERDSLTKQLGSTRNISDSQNQLRRESAMLEQERNEFEQQMADLEEVILNLKDRADRYDLLAKENELLRQQVQRQRIEAADKMRLVNAEAEANFNRMRAEECDRLEAELIMYKTQYDEQMQQKRDLKEQLRRMQAQQNKVGELKRLLAMEQAQREQVEEEMEHLLELYDKQSRGIGKRSSIVGSTSNVRRSLDQGIPIADSTTVLKESRPLVEDVTPVASVSPPLPQVAVPSPVAAPPPVVTPPSVAAPPPVAAPPRSEANTIDQQKLVQLTTQLQKCEADAEAFEQIRKFLEAQIASQEAELAQLHAKQAAETKEIEQLTLEMVALQKQTDGLKVQLDAKDAALSAGGGAGAQVVEMQKLLEDARKQLEEKGKQLDAVNKEVGQMQEQIKEHEVNQKIKDSELAAVKLEVEKAHEKTSEQPVGTSETDSLKRTNDDLRREVAVLNEQLASAQELARQLQQAAADGKQTADDKQAEQPVSTTESDDLKRMNDDLRQEVGLLSQQLASAQELARQLQQGAGDEAELLKNIADLKAELQAANEVATVKVHAEEQALKAIADSAEKEAVTEKMIAPVVEAAESEEGGVLEASVEEAELISEILGVHKTDDETVAEAVAKEKQMCVKEIEALQQKLLKCQEERLHHADIKDAIEEGIEEEPDQEDNEDLEELEATEGEESEGEESMTTMVAEESGEEHESNDEMSETELEQKEVGDGDGQGKASSHEDSLLDIESIGSSGGDRVRRIAFKIVRHGLTILIWPELDYLHHEICKAIKERYSKLNQNVQALDQALGSCNKLLVEVNTMRNNEMVGLVSSATQIPIRNPLCTLLDDEIPERLSPQKPKQKMKSARTSVVSSERQQVLSMFSKGVPAATAATTSAQRSSVNKTKSRVLVDSEFCRTRPWGPPPKTPTETFVASTLADGSRLYTRQKWQ